MPNERDMKKLAARTQAVYDRLGPRFDAERGRQLVERKWLRRFEAFLPEHAAILDAGCGAGEPIARYFIEKGYVLTGIDYAPSMIALAGERFPGSRWLVSDMRTLDLPERFDGILGWHSFFHLSPAEQRSTLPRLAAHLKPGGVLLLTVGTGEGEVVGHVGGEAVYHSSLSPDAYRQILHELGMQVIDFVFEDPECDFATVLLASSSPCAEACSRPQNHEA